METKYGCILIINTEEEHPEIVTTMTGVESTLLHVKGKTRINKKTGKELIGTQYIQNLWTLDEFAFGSEWGLENAIHKIVNVINSNSEFKTVFSTFKESFLRCYVYIEDYHLAFGLSPEIFHDLHKIGIPIEFDLYSFKEDPVQILPQKLNKNKRKK